MYFPGHLPASPAILQMTSRFLPLQDRAKFEIDLGLKFVPDDRQITLNIGGQVAF